MKKANDVEISWRRYHLAARKLASLVRRDRFSPSIIVCISRGGLPVGVMLSEMMKKPLGVITVQSYRGKSQAGCGWMRASPRWRP